MATATRQPAKISKPQSTDSGRPRRSQAQRSAATRQALLEATIASLVEDGYARTTTARVAERAGVSRGAHLHHFQTRQALVAAAIEHLTERRSEQLEAAAAALPPGEGRIAAGLDLLWASYANPLFQAALDLWTDARTDEDLRIRLTDVERKLNRQTQRLARRFFPEQAGRDDFERLIELAVATIRGLALLDTLHPDGARNRAQWPYCRAHLQSLLEGAPAGTDAG